MRLGAPSLQQLVRQARDEPPARGMRLGAPSLQQLVRQARDEPQVFLPHVVPHPAGTWIGLGSVALGAWAHGRDV